MSWFFEKFIYKLEAFSYIRIGLSLEKHLMSLQAMFTILTFGSPVCIYTFNPLPLSLKWVATLVATTYRNMESRQSYKTTHMMRMKESERRPFLLFLDWILSCTIHTRQMKLSWKSRNGNKKFKATMSKALAEFY